MRVVVFTLTRRYGGLDVTAACLRRSKLPDGVHVSWLVGDTLHRAETLRENCPDLDWWLFDAPKACAGYNHALEFARDDNYDLMLLLCDYTWIPEDGIARFVELAGSYPRSLLTGQCSHSRDPSANKAVDPEGLYTVFAKPYGGQKPLDIGWKDIRGQWSQDLVEGLDIVGWEANWAAIPRVLLDDERLVFNEEYDRGFGHENQAFAMLARDLGYNVVFDPTNHAIELPHREYFPDEWAQLTEIREEQQEWHHARRAERGEM